MNLDAQVKQDLEAKEALNKKFSIFAPNSARVVNLIEDTETSGAQDYSIEDANEYGRGVV